MKRRLNHLVCMTAAMVFFSNAYSQVPIPNIKKYGSTQFISGGIGVDECKALQSEACNWPLQLMFSEVQPGTTIGAWVSNVDIKLTDKDGNSVLSTVTDGPLVLVKLPACVYSLSANYLGKIVTRSISIQEGKSQTVSVYWVSK